MVTSPSLDPKRAQAIRDQLLQLHLDPQGQEILRGMGVDRFVVVDDAQYESIRRMRQFLARPAGDRKGP